MVSLGLPDTLKCDVCGEEVGIDDLRISMLPDETVVMHHSKCEGEVMLVSDLVVTIDPNTEFDRCCSSRKECVSNLVVLCDRVTL